MKKYIEKISSDELLSLREDQREKILLEIKEKVENAILISYRIEKVKDSSEYDKNTANAINLSTNSFYQNKNFIIDNPIDKNINHKMSLDHVRFDKIVNENSKEHQRNVFNHLLTAYHFAEGFMEDLKRININNPEIGDGMLANIKESSKRLTNLVQSERLNSIVIRALKSEQNIDNTADRKMKLQ